MASNAVIKQIAAIGLIQGMFDMLWEQKYQNSPRNKTYKALLEPLEAATRYALTVLKKECNGLNKRELATMQARIQRMSAELYPAGPIDAMAAVAMSIDLLGSILIKINKGTEKHAAMETVLTKVKALDRYYNRRGAYDETVGLDAAEKFKKLINQPANSQNKGVSCQPKE